MCGICGQFNFASDEPVESDMIRRMADSIAHRGPDDEGYFIARSDYHEAVGPTYWNRERI